MASEISAVESKNARPQEPDVTTRIDLRTVRSMVVPASIGDFMGIGAFVASVGDAWFCMVER
jgi:hypothetical protein